MRSQSRRWLVVLVACAVVVSLGLVPFGPGGFPLPGGESVRDALTKLFTGQPHARGPEVAPLALPLRQQAPTGQPTGPVERVRELADRRTATTRFFELSDGRVQAEVSAQPRFYRAPNGSYQPIDTTVGTAAPPTTA